MTVIKTMQIRILDPQAEHVIADLASRDYIEVDKPEEIDGTGETPLEWYDRWGRECAERRKLNGLPEESDITMEEIVAIVKEARAERYAREQTQKNSTRS
jgi:hypothetical protein